MQGRCGSDPAISARKFDETILRSPLCDCTIAVVDSCLQSSVGRKVGIRFLGTRSGECGPVQRAIMLPVGGNLGISHVTRRENYGIAMRRGESGDSSRGKSGDSSRG